MAIANSDGSIILSTKVDTSGLKSGMNSLQGMVGKIGVALAAAFSVKKVYDFVKAANDAFSEFEQLEGGMKKIFDQADMSQIMKDAHNAFLDLGLSVNEYLRKINDVGATFSAVMGDQKGYDTARKGLLAISDYASGTGKSVDVLSEKFTMITRSTSSYQSIADQFSGILPATSKDFLKQAQAAGILSDQYTELTQVPIAEYQEAVTEMLSKGVEQLGLTGNTAAEAASTISGSAAMMKAAWENTLVAISSGEGIDRAVSNLVYSIQKYFENIVPVVQRSLIGIGQLIEKTGPLLVQNVANAFIKAIPNLIMAVYQMIIGLIKGLRQGIADLINGTVNESLEAQAESIGVSVDNQKALTAEVKNTNKELKKTLAGFDDLQVITSGASDADSGTAGVEASMDQITSGVTPSESAGSFDPQGYADKIISAISAVLPYIAIGLVVIGLIVLATGNIPLGIGFIAAGAYLYSVQERSGGGFDINVIKDDLAVVVDYLPEALAAIGVLLLLLGQIPWGIGFIVAGAALYAAEEMESEEYDTASFETKLAVIMEAVSLALVGIGVLLIFFGHIPLGLGFIVAGYKLLDIAEEKVEEGGITPKIEKFFNENSELIVGVALALVVLGVLLLFVPGAFPIALGLIVGGAAALATEQKINGGNILTKLKDFIFENPGIILLISEGLLVIGLVLLLVPGVLPLAIACIAAGAAGLVTEMVMNKDAIIQKVKEIVTSNPEAVGLVGLGFVLIGILLCVIGLFPLGIAVISLGAMAMATPVVLNWNAIVNKVKEFLFENPLLVSLISGGLLIIGIILCVTGVGLPLGIALIALGAVGLASEVALHFDAIVTKIKEFLFENSTLVTLISGGLLILGLILCLAGVLPLGIGLIVAGAAGLATEIVLNKDAIANKIKEMWGAVKEFWNKNIAPVFTAEWWKNLGKGCVNGLAAGFEGGINAILGGFESMINWIVDKINSLSFDIPDWVPGIGGDTFGFNLSRVDFGEVKIPRLAKGAVIPANKEFLAVLGDQRQGVNIEAPLDTIVDAFQIALDSRGGTGTTEVVLEVDGREFGRAVVEQGNKENRRIGTRLVIV